jgi:glycosyltransferase involved in cell wall biosynthesis
MNVQNSKKIQVSNNQALVTIIICTYNRANYLNKCITSILAQTNQQWELIIVDDGSDDHTFNIVDSYIQAYSNIRYVKHKNLKLALSRNVGLLLATGKYITFLDSDDTYKENHIQSRLDFMKKNSEVDLIYGGVDLHEDIFVTDYYKDTLLINVKECVLGSTFFGKRNVFIELGGFENLNYGEDTEFLERASKIFITQKITHPQTYVYTRANDSITIKKELERKS